MSKIRIKNFGPIKEGYSSGDGFMEIKKVTILIGEQGTGKSTVAKLFTLLTWLEKKINRGDMPQHLRGIDIQDAMEWQRIKSYLSPDSEIEYAGNAYHFRYKLNEYNNGLKGVPTTEESHQKNQYVVPKIMYVPAERNFLSAVKGAYNVTGLSNPLLIFAEELKRAQLELDGAQVQLPIRDYAYEYDEFKDISHISGADHKINLLDASSGLQSLIPLYLVSKNLATSISKADDSSNANISVNQLIKRNNELAQITLDKNIPDNEKNELIAKINSRYHNKCFINIVEEPEQNLFPASQREVLNSLLEYAGMNAGNKLVVTTHSPYLINYLSIAIQAGELLHKINNANRTDLIPELNEIVPIHSCLSADDVVIYQLQANGSITRLPTFEGIPSDKNYLNESLSEGNALFDALLEIEQSI